MLAVLSCAGLLSACAVAPEPLTGEDHQARAAAFRQAVARQEQLSGPIDLHQAMARALRYNFGSRLKEVEREIAENRSGATLWTMLPKVVGSAGRVARDNTLASSSQSVNTGVQSLETSTSQDKIYSAADLKISWNVLDFGVSYYTARQMANQSLVAEERRKKVVEQLLNDVRDAYWRAVAADRLLGRLDQTLEQVRSAADRAEAIEQSRVQKPAEILNYQRDLYTKLLQLQGLRRTLVAAKLELAKLINLPPGQPFTVVIPETAPRMPPMTVPVAQLEEQALLKRPELVEESYQQRIAADEVRKSIARMFPGLELSASKNYNSNSFLLNQNWGEAGLKVTWNLMNLLSGWDDIEQAELQKTLGQVRREALGMAVLTQVNVAYLDYFEAEDAYRTASKIHTINERIESDRGNEAQTRNLGELELIQTQLNSLLSQMKKDEQYALVQNALGRLALSVGEDPFSDVDQEGDITALAERIAEKEKTWLEGEWFKTRPAS
ncbi:MAG: TolC family protein [Magnetospirillum sp.]|nr:TolC family protein [Magnetospirillum sp.]